MSKRKNIGRKVNFWVIYFAVVTLFLIIFTIWLFATDVFSADVVYKRKIKIAFVGDSITGGQFPYDLEILLGKKFKAEILVSQKDGARSSDIRRLLEVVFVDSVLKGIHFNYVVIYAGLNDCVSSKKNGEVAFENTLKMVEMVESHGATPIVIKHHGWSSYKFGDNFSCSFAYNRNIDNFVAESGTLLIDTSFLSCSPDGSFDFARLADRYDAGDGIHLNRLANKELAEKIFSLVR